MFSCPLIELKQFSLQTQHRTLISNLDWSIHLGQVWAIIGLSGCGKSSLLRAIAGLSCVHEFVYSGQIKWQQQVIQQYSNQQRVKFLAWVPQNELFMAHNMTVQDRVLLGLYAAKPGLQWESCDDLQRVEAALAHFGLQGRRLHVLHQLSGGEVKRVALACAYLQNATVTLFDEPLSQLDWRCQVQIGQTFLDYPNLAQRAVVWVTHDPNMALRFATHVLAFTEQGRIWQGRVADIVGHDLFEQVYGCRIQASLQPELYYPA